MPLSMTAAYVVSDKERYVDAMSDAMRYCARCVMLQMRRMARNQQRQDDYCAPMLPPDTTIADAAECALRV